MERNRNRSRRDRLFLLALLIGVAWGWQQFGPRDPGLSFAPITGLEGWQKLETGAISGPAADTVFLGIGEDAPLPLPVQELCRTLFPGPDSQIAVFTDINCPNCRSLEARLAARALPITWLQLPLLGPGSDTAARVAIAAETLTARPATPLRALRGTGRAALLRHHSQNSGVPVETLSREARSPRTEAILTRHRRAAETLRIYGTPAFVIGRTLVMGDVSEARLDQLLARDHGRCD